MEKIKFLDYEITHTVDGWVPSKLGGETYEINLCNYDNLEDAKRDCVLFYMIARPRIFHRNILNRASVHSQSQGTYHDFYLLIASLNSDNIPIPEEITCSHDPNCSIRFNNQEL